MKPGALHRYSIIARNAFAHIFPRNHVCHYLFIIASYMSQFHLNREYYLTCNARNILPRNHELFATGGNDDDGRSWNDFSTRRAFYLQMNRHTHLDKNVHVAKKKRERLRRFPAASIPSSYRVINILITTDLGRFRMLQVQEMSRRRANCLTVPSFRIIPAQTRLPRLVTSQSR